MTELIQEVQLALTELLQSRLDTGGPAAAPRLHALAAQCEELGLHTGASLLTQAEEALAARAHTMEKDDLPLAALLCRTARYLELCREKLQEESITLRWQSFDCETEGGYP